MDRNVFWRDRRVFITGCTGLVGSWLVRALQERGAHVVGLIRDAVAGSELYRGGLYRQMDVVQGSVEHLELMERALNEYEIQTVFHLAAQTIVGTANRCPLSTFETNIKGTWCLLEAARRCGTIHQVVIASSDKAYGEQEKLPYTEEAPLDARHPYDASKACTDLLSLTYHHTYRLPVCVTRCGNFYGGGDLNWNRIVPGTVRSVLRGERPLIRSDGSCIRDYFYVKDGAAAYIHLAECMARQPEVVGHAFNFSTEIQVSVLQMVRRIMGLMGSALEPDVRAEARNEIPHQYLSAAKARRMLHWTPQYSLDDALSETVAWYREYFGQNANRASEGHPPASDFHRHRPPPGGHFMPQDNRLFSMVVPVLNEQEVIRETYARLNTVLEELDLPFEVVVVDNGSTDSTPEIMAEICSKDRRWKFLRLSRNFGYQNSITAGMLAANGDAIMVIDADLQDPPELIATFVEKWKAGYDIVYGVREKRTGESPLRVIPTMLAMRFITWMSDEVKLPLHSGDFRLITRRVRDAFAQMPETSRYVRGMIHWLGFKQIGIPYVRRGRVGGHTKVNPFYLIGFMFNAVFNFSVKPLRMFSIFGLGVLALTAVLGLVNGVLWFLDAPPRGFTTVLMLLLLNLGVLSLGVGILGEYIAKIYAESKRRPLWLVDYSLNLETPAVIRPLRTSVDSEQRAAASF